MDDAVLPASPWERMRLSFRRLITNPPSALISLADQGVVSGFGFLSGIAAARLLGLTEFGHFALVLIVLSFAQALQNAVITAPMMTLAGGRGRVSNAYAANVLAGIFLLSLLGAVFVVVALLFSGAPSFGALAAALALMLAQNIQFTLRRLLFIQNKGLQALAMDFMRAACFPLVTVAMWLEYGTLGSSSFLWLLAGTSFVTTLPFVIRLVRPALLSARCIHLVTLLRRHKPIACWLLPIVFLTFLQEQLVWIAVGSYIGLDALGGLRAAQYLTGTVLLLLAATENVLPVAAARAYHQGGETALRRYLLRAVLLMGVPVASLLIVLALPAEFWLRLIFGSDFAVYAHCLQTLAVGVAIIFLRDIAAHYFRAKQNNRAVFLSLVVSLVASFAVVLPLATSGGVTGAAIAVVAGHAASLIYLLIAMRPGQRPRSRLVVPPDAGTR